jgi:hypothetical protein
MPSRGALEIDALVRNQERRQRQISPSEVSLLGRHGATTIRTVRHWLARGLLALAAFLEVGAPALVADADRDPA